MRHKKYRYKSDWMSRQMDEQLGLLEDRLTTLYANASFEVNAEFGKFAKTFSDKDLEMLAKLEAGSITEADYIQWRRVNILETDLYKSTLDSITGLMVNTDIAAMAIVNGDLPYVVAQSYNFVQSLGFKAADDAGLSVGTFQIYNAKSVEEIIKKNPALLPSVNVSEDKKWNQTKINNQITNSIVKGDSIPKVAENLQQVAKMDENTAIRSARTAMTAAENMGRAESASKLKEMGIPIDEVWSATLDERTRDTHLLLDGTKKDENGVFGADILNIPLRYPADPLGEPSEIYNCRCRTNVVLQGIDHSQDEELYAQFMSEQAPKEWEKLQESKSYIQKMDIERRTKDYQTVLKEITSKGYYLP